MGWKIDYQKLLRYLKDKYEVSTVFYFGGVEIHDFKYDYQTQETVSLQLLEKHLLQLLENKDHKFNEASLALLQKNIQQTKFYHYLENLGTRYSSGQSNYTNNRMAPNAGKQTAMWKWRSI